jgi:hypothetical protein
MYLYCNIAQCYDGNVVVWLFQSMCKVVTRLSGILGALPKLKYCDMAQPGWLGMLQMDLQIVMNNHSKVFGYTPKGLPPT